jgi:hypothetical protein
MIGGARRPADSPRGRRPRLTLPGVGRGRACCPTLPLMAQIAVSGAAVELTADVDPGDRSYSIAVSPTVDLYVELFAGVTVANGYRVPAGATLALDLTSGERLWGITSGAAGTAYTLRTGLA